MTAGESLWALSPPQTLLWEDFVALHEKQQQPERVCGLVGFLLGVQWGLLEVPPQQGQGSWVRVRCPPALAAACLPPLVFEEPI